MQRKAFDDMTAVHPVPPPHPVGLLPDPDAHKIRAALPGPAHHPGSRRGTRADLVPRRDLHRHLGRKAHRRIGWPRNRAANLPGARQRTITVLGHEQTGILPKAIDLLDMAVEIPMIGTGASLNVAVACSTVLYRLAGFI